MIRMPNHPLIPTPDIWSVMALDSWKPHVISGASLRSSNFSEETGDPGILRPAAVGAPGPASFAELWRSGKAGRQGLWLRNGNSQTGIPQVIDKGLHQKLQILYAVCLYVCVYTTLWILYIYTCIYIYTYV